jgi:hypothetical protein
MDDSLEHEYAIKGLALAVFAVGAFGVGRWLTGMVFSDTTDAAIATFSGWLLVVPLMMVFPFGLSHGAKTTTIIYAVQNQRSDWSNR